VSIHNSLKTKGDSAGHRNVLTRQERLDRLEEDGRWNEEKDSLLGIPKVRSIKVVMKKKKKKEEK